MQRAKAIIFDFDGTLADSFEVFLEVLGVVIKRSWRFTPDEIEDLRASSTKDVIKELGIKPWQIPLLVTKGRREMGARIERVKAFKGIPEIISELSTHYSIYILSTNSKENITKFLQKYHLTDCILGIYGDISLMGKARSLKTLQNKEALSITDCLYVGDETRDIEAARRVGMKCVAVQWGYGRPGALRSYMPDALIDTPQNLPGVIREVI